MSSRVLTVFQPCPIYQNLRHITWRVEHRVRACPHVRMSACPKVYDTGHLSKLTCPCNSQLPFPIMANSSTCPTTIYNSLTCSTSFDYYMMILSCNYINVLYQLYNDIMHHLFYSCYFSSGNFFGLLFSMSTYAYCFF